MKHFFSIVIIFQFLSINAQEVAVLEYDGGGDWYANPTAVPNLIVFCNENINTTISPKPKTVKPQSGELFAYPIIFMTGHGNIFLDDDSADNLRLYLESGGFIHISDNYGFDTYIRREFKKVFPEQDFEEVPLNHPIYNQTYQFPNGVPKIHEHDAKPPKGYGLFYKGRLVCFYDYESDLSDGWETPEVHNDPPELRLKALQMGANIIEYCFSKP
ncbi:MAG: hypothetical protein CR968_02730 [Flavobacteriia bacterium]|nr:MAG: hypothetical protein CR968_02730 [Flavobacteriia bacterium]